MAIIKQIEPYEFLARFNKEGIQGMHVQNIEKVFDDVTGEVYAEKELGAKSIAEDSEEFQVILDRINSLIQTENEALKAENESLKVENEKIKNQNILLAVENEKLKEYIANLQK